MALSSLRGVSTVQTPPEGRQPIDTTVSPFKKKTVAEAIRKELEQQGQVYYLHNRIGTMQGAKELIKELVPKARVETAHARLS
ncbi:MAG: DEAD/DEAH box helicase, partial [bacterium]|nr:DEAD/DEAH box helicase [bacterium]